MEPLVLQIARTIEQNQNTDKPASVCSALKEMVFSGMSRSGFFKECVYAEELDLQSGRDLHACFLYTGSEKDFSGAEYKTVILDELRAFGSDPKDGETKTGFMIETTPEGEDEAVRLFIDIFPKKAKEQPVRFSYVHAPLAYELRTAADLSESAIADLQSRMKSAVKAAKPANKKVPKKARSEKKEPEDPKEKWVQPSLFDF